MKGKLSAVFVAFLIVGFFSPGTAQEGSKVRKEVVRVSAGSSSQAWLGVSIQDISPKLKRKKDLKVDEGAFVSDVAEESPADSAGIKEGDVILEFGEKKIDDADDLLRAVNKAKAGSKVKIVLQRGDEKKTFQLAVGKRPRSKRSWGVTIPPIPRVPHIEISKTSMLMGLHLEGLNEQLGQYFGAPDGKGVLVKKVDEKSSASEAGFKAGDVIVKVAKEKVEDVDDVHEALENYDEGEKVTFEVLRKGTPTTILLEIEDKEGSASFNYFFKHAPESEDSEDLHIDDMMDGVKLKMEMIAPRLRELERKIIKLRSRVNVEV